MKNFHVACYAFAALEGLIFSVRPEEAHDGSPLKLVTVFAMLCCIFIAAMMLSIVESEYRPDK